MTFVYLNWMTTTLIAFLAGVNTVDYGWKKSILLYLFLLASFICTIDMTYREFWL